MIIPHCRYLALPVLSLSLMATHADASPASTASTTPASPPANLPSTQVYDQIVRLSLIEGDVRVSRGKEGEHATGDAWGVAAVNLPINSGFSLVTGTGRAEIEFEDASTIYLGDNSVLTFNQLTTTGGVPDTELTLVSGTVTLHVQPTFSGESFSVSTPTARFSVRYGGKAFMRIDSYLDAVSITPQEGSTILVDNTTAKNTAPGQTVTYSADHKLVSEGSSGPNAFAEWDEWTAKRIAARAALVAAVMKDSGLRSPIPGLAEMNGQGTFFDCAPYGTCWEPTGGWGKHEAETGPVESQQTSETLLRQSTASAHLLLVAQALQSGSPAAILRTEYDDDLFPCLPGRVRRLISRDPLTGRETVLRTDIDSMGRPGYDWAVCHTGNWINRGHRYVWVAGTHRHHHCPVRWVNYGRSKAYVPIHPHDVAGKPPINLKYGVFETSGKKGESVAERVAFDPSTQVKVLTTAPKEFRTQYFPPLQRAETPRVEAHLVKDGIGPGRNANAKSSGTAITFDHKSQSFMVARPVTAGNRTTMVTQRFGGHEGGGQVRSGGGSWSGGSRGSNTASASRSSSSGGSSGAGGASHASSGGGGGGASSGGSSGGGSHK
jgi:hypothetical protein